MDAKKAAATENAVIKTPAATEEVPTAEHIEQRIEPVAPVPEVKKDVGDDQRDQKIVELTSKLNEANGKFGGTVDRLKRELESQEAKSAELELSLIKEREIPRQEPDFVGEYRGTYDDDTLNMIKSVTESIVAEKLKSIPSPQVTQNDNSQQLQAMIEEQSRMKMWASIESAHPGARATNNNPKFVEFLEKNEDLGGNYKDAAERAFAMRDVVNVVQFFDAFDRSISGEGDQKKQALSAQITPKKSISPSSTTQTVEKQLMTKEEIVLGMEQLTSDARTGRITSDELNNKLAELKAAYNALSG